MQQQHGHPVTVSSVAAMPSGACSHCSNLAHSWAAGLISPWIASYAINWFELRATKSFGFAGRISRSGCYRVKMH